MTQKIVNNNDEPESIILEKFKKFKSEKEDPWFQRVADLFLIACGLGGDIFDVLSFKWKHWKNGKMKFDVTRLIQSKPRHTYMAGEVEEELAQLIMKHANEDKSEEAYIFPFLTPNLNDDNSLAEADSFKKTMDEYLEKISEILGIEKISVSDVKRLRKFYRRK